MAYDEPSDDEEEEKEEARSLTKLRTNKDRPSLAPKVRMLSQLGPRRVGSDLTRLKGPADRLSLAPKVKVLSQLGTGKGGPADRPVLAEKHEEWWEQACFIPGTQVLGKQGLTPIEELKAGDEVVSCDGASMGCRFRPIEEVHRSFTTKLVQVEVGGIALTTTPRHPFFVVEVGTYVAASELKAGWSLRSQRGESEAITRVTIEELGEPLEVFNFTVAEDNNYYVTANRCGYETRLDEEGQAYLVHNCGFGLSLLSRPFQVLAVALGSNTIGERALPEGWQGFPDRAEIEEIPLEEKDQSFFASAEGQRMVDGLLALVPLPQPLAQKGVKWAVKKAREGKSDSGGNATGYRGRRGLPENPEHGLPRSDGLELRQPFYQPVRNSPAVVNGREYSGHALDQMQNRGLMPSVVENAINSGTKTVGRRPGTFDHVDTVNKIKVVTDQATGNVVTIIPQ